MKLGLFCFFCFLCFIKFYRILGFYYYIEFFRCKFIKLLLSVNYFIDGVVRELFNMNVIVSFFYYVQVLGFFVNRIISLWNIGFVSKCVCRSLLFLLQICLLFLFDENVNSGVCDFDNNY